VREAKAVAYSEIESQDDTRIPSGVTEFDRVLGGGIVPGTLVLLGGDPGIGKSTLLLQVADKLSSTGSTVLYISGEESERQIKLRGERLRIAAPNLLLLPETNLENADFIGGSKTVFGCANDAMVVMALAFEIKHGIDDVFERFRAGN